MRSTWLAPLTVALAVSPLTALAEPCPSPQKRSTLPLQEAAQQDEMLALALGKAGKECAGGVPAACAEARQRCATLQGFIDEKAAARDVTAFLADLQGGWLSESFRSSPELTAGFSELRADCEGDAASLAASGEARKRLSDRRRALLGEYERWYEWAQKVQAKCLAQQEEGEKKALLAQESARQDAERQAAALAAEKARQEKLAADKARQEQALATEKQRKEKELAEKKAADEREQLRLFDERRKQEEQARAKAEADRKAKEEADQRARAEIERRGKEEADRRAREAEQRARLEAEKRAREEAVRKEEESRRRAEKEAKAREEAEKEARRRAENETQAREKAEREAEERREEERRQQKKAEEEKQRAEEKARSAAEVQQELERRKNEAQERQQELRKEEEERRQKAEQEAADRAREEQERRAKLQREREEAKGELLGSLEEKKRKAAEEEEREAKRRQELEEAKRRRMAELSQAEAETRRQLEELDRESQSEEEKAVRRAELEARARSQAEERRRAEADEAIAKAAIFYDPRARSGGFLYVAAAAQTPLSGVPSTSSLLGGLSLGLRHGMWGNYPDEGMTPGLELLLDADLFATVPAAALQLARVQPGLRYWFGRMALGALIEYRRPMQTGASEPPLALGGAVSFAAVDTNSGRLLGSLRYLRGLDGSTDLAAIDLEAAWGVVLLGLEVGSPITTSAIALSASGRLGFRYRW